MKHYFFAYLSRMRYITRWALMRNTVPENVQEHSHDGGGAGPRPGRHPPGRVPGKPCDPNACAAAALFHDATEILTGDLPTPVKYNNPAIRDAYKSLERGGPGQTAGGAAGGAAPGL